MELMWFSCLARQPPQDQSPGRGWCVVAGRGSDGVSEHVKTRACKHPTDPAAAARDRVGGELGTGKKWKKGWMKMDDGSEGGERKVNREGLVLPSSHDPPAAVRADDARHRVPAGPRAPVGEVHGTCAHITREFLERAGGSGRG